MTLVTAVSYKIREARDMSGGDEAWRVGCLWGPMLRHPFPL